MRRWPAVLSAAALVFTASLYLPWQTGGCGPRCLDLFSHDGWSADVADAAALSALVLAAVAAVAVVRPNLQGRLPLGLAALFVGYFGLAVAAEMRSVAQQHQLGGQQVEFHYAYGAYIGVAAAVAAMAAAGAMSRHNLARFRSASGLATIILGVALLAAFLLPWERAPLREGHVALLGIAGPAAAVAAALTLCLLVPWRAEARPARLGLGLAIALSTGGAFSALLPGGSRAYGAWIGLGAAIALVAVPLLGRLEVPGLHLPRLPALAAGGAAALLITGLFLPWQRECFERAKGFGPYGGRCFSTNGWINSLGAAAALLAIGLGLVIVTAVSRRWFASVVLAAGIGLLVATFGFGLSRYRGNGFRLDLGFGSTLGFVGAGLLLAPVLAGVRPRGFGRDRVPARLVPIAACVAYLFVVVVPWWGVLPWRVQIALTFAPLSWLTIAGLLLALWLLQLWVDRISAAGAASNRLLIAPLALLALAALDLIRAREDVITWGRGIVVGACLLLCALGRIEQQVGLENVQVPSVLRVDRL